MKKIIFILLLFCLFLLNGCESKSNYQVSIIVPSGTPSLGISSFIYENRDSVQYEIVSGSDPLVSAFLNKKHNIIIAPVNLGAKMYKNNGNYQLYKTFVWGNTYIASKNSISNITDLEEKKVVAFGENSTPGIVLKSLLKYYEVTCEISYVDDVAAANMLLMSGKADIILTAEPSLSKINKQQNLFILDLQTLWKEMTGKYSYPQAAIFVNKDHVKDEVVKDYLEKMLISIDGTKNSEIVAKHAVEIDESFMKLGEETLINAIPRCHYALYDDDKEAIEFYFEKLDELGLSAMYGGSLPDEAFYLS